MAAQKGTLFLLKVGDGGGPETFTTVGGLKTASFNISTASVDVTNMSSNGMRELLAGAGIQTMSLSGNGVFTDSAAEETVRANAAANSIDNYQLVAGNGDTWQGAFLITSYQRSGNFDGAEAFTISLESSGAITFTAG